MVNCKGTMPDFSPRWLRIQTSNLSVTDPTLLTARLPATRSIHFNTVIQINSSSMTKIINLLLKYNLINTSS
jgi:hypothetical protein